MKIAYPQQDSFSLNGIFLWTNMSSGRFKDKKNVVKCGVYVRIAFK